MILVQWKDDYSVGAEPVDEEHKALIARINRLYDRLMNEDVPSAVSAFFDDLISAVTTHVALEGLRTASAAKRGFRAPAR